MTVTISPNEKIRLDPFTLAYVETALWSSTDGEGNPLDKSYKLSDIAPETLKEMVKDCESFKETARDLLAGSGLSPERAGHNFWLTRNRHGAGFWDEGCPNQTELTDQAHGYGSFDLYIGDDGKLYGN